MKVKDENIDKFIIALQNIFLAFKREFEISGDLCGGLNEKEQIVIYFVGQNKSIKMTEIASMMAVPMSTLTSIVDKLVDRKYLYREHSGDDRRAINVTLAENGKTSHRLIRAKKKVAAERLLARFNEEDQLSFLKNMDLLAAHIGMKK